MESGHAAEPACIPSHCGPARRLRAALLGTGSRSCSDRRRAAEHRPGTAGARTRTILGAPAGALIGAYAGLGDLSGIGAQAGRLACSRADEREADDLAACITARAGYDLVQAGGTWAKLADSAAPATAGLLDTHPAGPERLAAWEAAEREIAASPEGLPRPAGS